MKTQKESSKSRSENQQQLWRTDNLYELLAQRRQSLQQVVEEKKTALENAPEGSIRIARRKKGKERVQYYLRSRTNDKSGTYIRKEHTDLIQSLMQKEYDQKILARAKCELNYVNRLLSHTKPDNLAGIYEYLPPLSQHWIDPVFQSDQEYAKEWNSREYTRMGFDPNEPAFTTRKGERVRSKSEMLIANLLYEYKIPYLYEFPLQDETGTWARPDFVVLNVKERREFCWEHLGMLDNPQYLQKNLKKIARYENRGYVQGKNLLLTYESSTCPINMEEAELLIQTFLI